MALFVPAAGASALIGVAGKLRNYEMDLDLDLALCGDRARRSEGEVQAESVYFPGKVVAETAERSPR